MILVMCLGNRNRSPLVAALLRKESKLEVQSAGFLEGGKRTSPAMRLAAKKYGLDLEQHRSVQVTDGMIEDADIILGFTQAHLRRLQDQFDVPGVHRKWRNLALYCKPPKESIADPAFATKRTAEIAAECVKAVRGWLRDY